jgi:hypothetical protein
VAEDWDPRRLIVIYVGDYDPSGMFMSEKDLLNRLEKYDGDHVIIRRLAIMTSGLMDLPTFPAEEKKKDTRYPWFIKNYGHDCCELDALDPNELRRRVKEAIEEEIDPVIWKRCITVQEAERHRITPVAFGSGHHPPHSPQKADCRPSKTPSHGCLQ